MLVMSHNKECGDAGWFGSLMIQPLQRAAAKSPAQPTHSLLRKRRMSINAKAKLINDFLADPAVR